MSVSIYDSEQQTYTNFKGETVPLYTGSYQTDDIVGVLENYKHGYSSLQEAYTLMRMLVEKGCVDF